MIFFLAFYLAYILDILSGMHSDILFGIQSDILSDITTFYPASFLTFHLTFQADSTASRARMAQIHSGRR